MKEYSKEIGFLFILVLVVVGMNISKESAIQEQRELFYQTIESAEVLSQHYADKKSPIEAVEKYFDYFNKADKKALNDNSDTPFIFSIGTETTAHEKYGDSVDFEGLKNIGWAYSSINDAELIYKDNSSAMVAINFSRYNQSDEPISTTDVTYMLVFKDDMWKLKAGFVQGQLSLGKSID